jgi:hypothetical protein
MLYPIGGAEEDGPFEPPIGNKDNVVREKFRRGEIISEIVLRQEIELYPAIRAGEKAVGLLQYDRAAALRTFMFNLPMNGFRSFHRTGCNKLTLASSQNCSEGIF